MEFNLQEFLTEMKRELREDNDNLRKEMKGEFDKGGDWMHSHDRADDARFASLDTRLKPIETVHRGVLWLIGVLIVATATAIGAVWVEHVNHDTTAVVQKVKP